MRDNGVANAERTGIVVGKDNDLWHFEFVERFYKYLRLFTSLCCFFSDGVHNCKHKPSFQV